MNRTCMLPGQWPYHNSHICRHTAAKLYADRKKVCHFVYNIIRDYCLFCTVSNIVCLHEEGPTGPKHCIKLWSCVHSKIDLTIHSQILSYNITSQSLAERFEIQTTINFVHNDSGQWNLTGSNNPGNHCVVWSTIIICIAITLNIWTLSMIHS